MTADWTVMEDRGQNVLQQNHDAKDQTMTCAVQKSHVRHPHVFHKFTRNCTTHGTLSVPTVQTYAIMYVFKRQQTRED